MPKQTKSLNYKLLDTWQTHDPHLSSEDEVFRAYGNESKYPIRKITILFSIALQKMFAENRLFSLTDAPGETIVADAQRAHIQNLHNDCFKDLYKKYPMRTGHHADRVMLELIRGNWPYAFKLLALFPEMYNPGGACVEFDERAIMRTQARYFENHPEKNGKFKSEKEVYDMVQRPHNERMKKFPAILSGINRFNKWVDEWVAERNAKVAERGN
jgi:hypothetical protein